MHLTFNYAFNIQLSIQLNSTFLSPHYFWSVTHSIACYKHGGVVHGGKCRLQKWQPMKMMTQGIDFDVESDLPRFFSSILQRTDQISQSKLDNEIVEQHIVVVDQTVRYVKVHTATRWTIRHGLMLLWFEN